MKPNKFLETIEKYQMILEQAPDIGGEPATTPTPETGTPAVGGETPPQPQVPPKPPEKASQGYTTLTNIILDAFKTIKPKYHDDIKYSDNQARDSREAFKYFEIVKRNLPDGIQNKISQIGGKGGYGDVDELTIVNMANLALQALFTRPKDQESSEFNAISSIEKVTPENAKQVYQQIRDYLSVVAK